ncbi:MAG: hypothetical protein KatS3mg081_0967 [Gemmatimonadales bacterium]|nr:hypothetical protein HRbin33_00213 [bacterium HR33]GIW51612.1 MAG: hypothetical protein KatS3mg081_0967 [Gemmatimonadales bacterium]
MRVAAVVGEAIPPAELERVWLFSPLRQEDREWGTAVLARRGEGGRVRVYTARYMLVLRGRERGQSKVTLEEVGEGPAEVVEEIVRGVRERSGELEPPVEISVALWYGAEDDQPAAQG